MSLPSGTESSSISSAPRCAICKNKAVYTCPACSTRTCCLNCSKAHKTSTGCTGQRNKVAYVPMNQYSWGTMMNDYVFLEDVGRKVGDWGKEIVVGGYGTDRHTMRGGRGMLHGRGGMARGRSGRTNGETKRDALKAYLDTCQIDVDLLPKGMERRINNQSSWDVKNQKVYLTIEILFYKPSDPCSTLKQSGNPYFLLLSHRNDIDKTLLSLVRKYITERGKSKRQAHPEWIKHLLFPDNDDPEGFILPQFVMQARTDSLAAGSPHKTQSYVDLDPNKKLVECLRGTHFVEFPTIEIWEEFKGRIVNTQGLVTKYEKEEGRVAKRRKLSTKEGKAAINGLLGDYGSEESNDEEVEEPAGLSILDDYEDSGMSEGHGSSEEDEDESIVIEVESIGVDVAPEEDERLDYGTDDSLGEP